MESEIRTAAFRRVSVQADTHRGASAREVLSEGFRYYGERVTILGTVGV